MAIQEGFSMARLSFFDEVNFLLSKELRREKPFHNSLIQDKDLKNQGINTIIRRRKKDLILSRWAIDYSQEFDDCMLFSSINSKLGNIVGLIKAY